MVPFLAVLCAPPRSGCSHPAGAGFIRNCLIHALLRQSMTRSARDYHGPYLAVIAALSLTIPPGVLPIADEVIACSTRAK